MFDVPDIVSFHDGRHIPIQYTVLIHLTQDTVSGVKFRVDQFAGLDMNVVREQTVETPGVYVRTETGITFETGCLAKSMHTGICSPGPRQTDGFSGHGSESFFDLSLNGPICLLTLPAVIGCAVIFHDQFEIFQPIFFWFQSINPTERDKNENIVDRTMADDASSVSLLSWDERT